MTLHVPIAGLATRHGIGVSRYSAFIREAGDSAVDERGRWIEPETDNTLVHLRLAGDIAPASSPSWAAGYEVLTQHAIYDGPEPRYYPVRPDTLLRIVRDDRTVRMAAWADRRWQTGALSVQPGLRIESGTRALNVAATRISPRLQARLMLGSGTILSLAAGRTWQDLQALSVAGPSAHPAFHAGQFWLQAGEHVPALRADLLTAGLEQWLGRQWLAGVSVFRRNSRGVVMPDPRPGTLQRRPRFAIGNGSADGAEASVRRIAGAWTGSAGYSWSETSVEADGYTFPAPADRTHRVDATLAVRLPGGMRVGAAWTAMGGAPYTRTYTRAASPDCELFGFGCGAELNGRIDAPNAERTPDYRSLDAMVIWTRGLGRFDLTTYLQLRNVLDRNNASTYSGTVPRVVRGRGGISTVEWIDRFEAGLPRMPLIGARVAF